MYTHQCEEFRERIAAHIIDREDLSANAEFQRDLLLCSGCSDFYAESREMIDAISSVDFAIPDDRWDVMTDRLRARIESEPAAVPVAGVRKIGARRRAPLQWGELVAVAALLLTTVGLYRVAIPEQPIPPASGEYIYLAPSIPLDPVTVDFLEESELLLRTVMKMEPSDSADLADAMRVAASQLAVMNQRKEAAAIAPPVLSVMQTYETVLRDIRNLNEDSPVDDIGDIQKRIRNNALIANLKAFQPAVSLVDFSFRR